MAVFGEVFGAFGLTIVESKTQIICMPLPRAAATQIVFNATGKQYRHNLLHLFGWVAPSLKPQTPNLSDEIDRRIRAGWTSFRRYTRQLYDHPKASLLHLKVWMVRF